ncbi:low molecular weight phosphatase family protein [Afifella sp. IM 167]|uniref:arsenate-mycothiol transferase ArsC n=1 Tax=Afifella sp. IM 167 TaxID=2033586 RepID=UPI001CCC42B1|nr:low molecular weight phosphatase family protein [Afifella sp. IM 167]MBZ8135117.1 protein-tyrosine-phosphatase [Afifella sp. IM 167]
MSGSAPRAPASILFLCGRNSVRSPMAEALARAMLGPNIWIASAGISPGARDPFVDSVLSEIGLGVAAGRPQGLDGLEDYNFDLAVTLSPEAHHRALELTRTTAIEVEYWPTPDPTLASGSREQILSAYRDLRERLKRRIASRFIGAD